MLTCRDVLEEATRLKVHARCRITHNRVRADAMETDVNVRLSMLVSSSASCPLRALAPQEEGIVVKDTTSPWKMNDRGTAWQKIKPGAALHTSAT